VPQYVERLAAVIELGERERPFDKHVEQAA
jgi:hypothetical protein